MEKKKNNNILHTERVFANAEKSFFLDLKKAENDSNYLVITQSKVVEADKYERTRMILFDNEIEEFAAALSRMFVHFTKRPRTQLSEEKIDEIRQTHPNAFQPWTKEDEELLTTLFNEGKTMKEMSKALQRNFNGVKARLERLGLRSRKEVAA